MKFSSGYEWMCNRVCDVYVVICNVWETRKLGWPMSWRFTMVYLHNEGLYKWVNSATIFFWYELLPTTFGPQKFSKIRSLKVTYFHFPSKKISQIENMIKCLCNYHFLLIRFKIYVNFQKIISPKMGLTLVTLLRIPYLCHLGSMY